MIYQLQAAAHLRTAQPLCAQIQSLRLPPPTATRSHRCPYTDSTSVYGLVPGFL